MFKEFRQFIARGNVIELAVGIMIGAAFGKIVTSLVEDIIMAPLGLLFGSLDFSSYFVNLSGKPYESAAQAKAEGAAGIYYGLFLNNVIQFLIIALVLFIIIQQFNRLLRRLELEQRRRDNDPTNDTEDYKAPEPPPSKEIKVLMEIRDLLSQQINPPPPEPAQETKAPPPV